jgi:hypothetical protein
MYNKQVLSEALANLQKRKAQLSKPKDIIVDPMGQYNHPGKNTRIPGGDITMANVPYPVMAYPNIGQPQMMYPEQDYNFPGADYVDEYPMMQSGGQRPILYVDRNDPEGVARYQSYADSLQAFNITNSRFDHPNAYHKKSKKYGLYINPEYKERDAKTENKFIEDFIKKGNKAEWKTYPLYKDQTEEELLYPVNSYIEYGSFKKPVQPVKYKPNPEIVAKQQQLIDAGFNIGKADGIWGPKSQAAWEQMQTKPQEVPIKSLDTSSKQVETVTPALQRKEEPTGITRQVPKSQWKQLPDGTWYEDTKAGTKASVEEYNMMQIGGSATAADSLAVANSAREVANYYTNKNYSLDSAWEKFTDGSTGRSLHKDRLDPFWAKTKKETYNERLKELKDYPSPEGSAGYYDFKYKTGPKKGQFIPYEDYFKQINDHQYKQREEKNLIMDTRSPMPLYDTRMYPSGQVYLINEDKKDPYFGDQVTFPLYDPLAVTPWNMLSTEDKKLRLEIYGSEGTPIKGYAPNKSKAENRLKELYKSNPQQKKEPNLNTDLAAWLKTQGASASYADRKKLYEQATGQTDYKGTAEQNIGLLNLVKERGLDYKIDNLEKVPSNTSDETAFVKSLSKMPERSEESVETSITPLPVKEEPKGLTKQVPKTTNEWNEQLQMYVPITRGGLNTLEDTGVDIGGRKLKYGGLTTGLTNTNGNLLMNKKGKRLMAQSGSLSATNELFLGNPLITKRKKAVYVPGHAFQEGGDTGYVKNINYNRLPVSYEHALKNFVYPKVIDSSEETGYDAGLGVIKQNPNDPIANINNPWWYEHELMHHLQNQAGAMSTYGAVGLRPNPYVASNESMGAYYNRRSSEYDNELNRILKQNPNISEEEARIRAEEDLYNNPTTTEGEARDYEDYIEAGNPSIFPKKQKGGYVVEEYQDGKEIISEYGWDYKKEGDQYFTKKVGTDKWIKPKGDALNKIKTDIYNEKIPVSSSAQSMRPTQMLNVTNWQNHSQNLNFEKIPATANNFNPSWLNESEVESKIPVKTKENYTKPISAKKVEEYNDQFQIIDRPKQQEIVSEKDLIITEKHKELFEDSYKERANVCNVDEKGNSAGCLNRANNYFDKFVAPQIGSPTTWQLKENLGISSGDSHPRYEEYGESADSWDLPGLLAEKDSKVHYKAPLDNTKEYEKTIHLDPEKRSKFWKDLDLPLGTYVFMGDQGGAGGKYGDKTYNSKAGLVNSNHSAIVGGYDEEGYPMLYDQYGLVNTNSADWTFGTPNVTSIITPKGTKEVRFADVKKKKKQETEGAKALRIELPDKRKTYYDETEMKPFVYALEAQKSNLAGILGVTSDEYDELAKIAVATALTETGGGNDATIRFMYGLPIPSYLTDKVGIGESKGLTQLNDNVVDNLFKNKETAIKLKQAGIKEGEYDPWNGYHQAVVTMLLLKENEKVIKNKLKNNPGNNANLPMAALHYYQWNNPGALSRGEAQGDNINVKRFYSHYNTINNNPNPQTKAQAIISGHYNISKQQGGAIDAELTPDEIEWYMSQGYNVEEL